MFLAGAMGKPAARRRALVTSGPRVQPIAATNVAPLAAGAAVAAGHGRAFVRGHPRMFAVMGVSAAAFFSHLNSNTLQDLTSTSSSAAVLGSQDVTSKGTNR